MINPNKLGRSPFPASASQWMLVGLRNVGPATGYSLAGPGSGSVGAPSSNFVVTLTPAGGTVAGTVTVTPSDGGGGGTFTPTTVSLSTASPSATFTYTAASAGVKTISSTNSGSLSNPTSLSYIATSTSHLLITLISYWKLDEVTGPWNDSVGTNHLNSGSPPSSATGKINNSVLFNSAGPEYLFHTSNASLQVTSDFTFSMWVKPSSIAGSPSFLSKAQVSVDSDYIMFIGGGGEAVMGVGTITLGTQYAISPPGSLVVGTWSHVVAWYDNVTGQLYLRINDASTSQSTAALPLVQTVGDFNLGRSLTTNYNGIIDEVGFWKRKLTSGEITDLYNGGAGLPFSSFTT